MSAEPGADKVAITSGGWAAGLTGFYADDLLAIRAGAERDGHGYRGPSVTPGHASIRNPGTAVLVALASADRAVGFGDATAVQYAGVAGRDPVLDPAVHGREVDAAVAELSALGPISFREACATIEDLELEGARLSAPVRYGVSQAVLSLLADVGRRGWADVLCDEYGLGPPRIVPLYAQSGDERRRNVDKMVLKRVDEIPHGLVNSPDVFGPDGEALLQYAAWVRRRITELGGDGYAPVLHFDVYGMPGIEFAGDVDRIAAFCERLQVACAPLHVRVEAPIDAGAARATAEALAALRRALRMGGVPVDVVADDWCNDLEDIRLFLELGAADMIQVKTPDLGALSRSIEAAVLAREAGALVYIGGSCNETDLSGRMSVHAAMSVHADVLLAKPGMGVDEAVMTCRNEQARTILRSTVAAGA